MRRPKPRLMAAPPMITGKRSPRASSPCRHAGICLLVLTSSALSPMASASTSTALSMIVFTGTCLPRSNTV